MLQSKCGTNSSKYWKYTFALFSVSQNDVLAKLSFNKIRIDFSGLVFLSALWIFQDDKLIVHQDPRQIQAMDRCITQMKRIEKETQYDWNKRDRVSLRFTRSPFWVLTDEEPCIIYLFEKRFQPRNNKIILHSIILFLLKLQWGYSHLFRTKPVKVVLCCLVDNSCLLCWTISGKPMMYEPSGFRTFWPEF